MNKKIILYYKYIDLQSPQEIKAWQEELCATLNLEGRIILAHEGINGTLCGSFEAIQAYIDTMDAHPLMNGIDFKESVVNGNYQYFPGMYIALRKEIVNMGKDWQEVSYNDSGTHLTPQQAHELIGQHKDLVILDGRNYYEARVGAFQNAITPEIDNFREFPAYIDDNVELFKDKDVLMYCTGGIRCERASAYLQAKGVAKNIYQIEGGIHRYVEAFPDGFFRGKNYVFDARVAVPVNDDIIGTCDLCESPYDTYTNCRNAKCNKHFIACPTCINQLKNACSQTCFTLLATHQVPERPYRPTVNPALE